MNKCRVLTVANQKGGVAKSTTVLNLAYALKQQGKRVLMIDLDPQASLTICSNVPDVKLTVEDMLKAAINEEPIPDCIYHGPLDIIPSSISLFAIEPNMKAEVGSEHALSDSIEPLKGDYDFIIIDTAPSLGMLSVNAMVAGDEIIITVSPEFLSSIGIKFLLSTIRKVQKHIKPQLRISGILMTMCKNTNLQKDILYAIETSFGDKLRIFKTQIPQSVKVGEANLNRKSIIEYDPKNKAAISYQEFASEILDEVAVLDKQEESK